MNKKLYTFVVVTLFCTIGFAQQQTLEETKENKVEELNEVVVSDSRFQLKRENSGKTVIKITQEELAKNQGRTVAEIINTKSGIEVNGSRSNAGNVIGSFVRGGNNRQVLVIIDGIQVSDPSAVNAEYDLRLLSTSQIESIEILKGAASTLYGNAAAAAVINITTKTANTDGLSANFESSIGSNQSQDDSNYDPADFSNHLTIAAKQEKIAFLVGFGHQYTDGLSAVIGEERDPYSRINGNVKFGYRFSEAFDLGILANYDKFQVSYDGTNPTTFAWEDQPNTSETEQLRFGISPKFNYGNGSLTLNLAINSIDSQFNDSFPRTTDSQSIIGDIFNKYNFDDTFYTIVGLNYIQNKTLFFAGEEETTAIDPYLNVVYVSELGVNLNAGARLNNHSEYGTNFIYNFNPSFAIKIGEGYAKLFGSYATSFIAPNLSQLYGAFGPNPDLDPETNVTIEGGVEYRPSKKMRVSGLYFNRKEQDVITFTTIDFTTFEGKYLNAEDEFTAKGVEVELSWKPSETLSFDTNYTFTERTNDVRLRLPKHRVNAVVGYNINKNTFTSLSYQYSGKRIDTDFSTFTNVVLDAFNLFDVYLSHRLNDRFKFFASINNVLDEDYLEVVDFTTRGRNVRLGFSLSL
ncbi:TonB-dependent receptor plug domain-containing protein [Sungkyunkwania multivorans]|uniref:TonB-dependent receptor plug domain-containing protein n=1 Tax=Sungkyunkwania multivorans TaxID=1173618 RepID=A0ABW3CZU1_9FLAO